jgi:hypothetical protein
VEADIGHYKRVIGEALRSRSEGRQTAEVAIAVASLNRMLELGPPEYPHLTSGLAKCYKLNTVLPRTRQGSPCTYLRRLCWRRQPPRLLWSLSSYWSLG